MQPLAILEPGRLGYAEATALQQELARRRAAAEIPDTLVLLEHTPVITLGRNAKLENLLAGPPELSARGVTVAECDRGGDVTYHGPGQLVGYPILDLRSCPRPAFLPPKTGRLELGPVEYVRALEEVLIRSAFAAGIAARRIPGLTGVWTAGEPARKLAAIGVHIARGITTHGFALNVRDQLDNFGLIVPCGIGDRGITALERESRRAWTLAEAATLVKTHFLAIFDRELAAPGFSWDDKTSQTGSIQRGPDHAG
jgi:lipoyl(octanoyl) transferase